MLDYHNRCFALCHADFQLSKHLVYSYAPNVAGSWEKPPFALNGENQDKFWDDFEVTARKRALQIKTKAQTWFNGRWHLLVMWLQTGTFGGIGDCLNLHYLFIICICLFIALQSLFILKEFNQASDVLKTNLQTESFQSKRLFWELIYDNE